VTRYCHGELVMVSLSNHDMKKEDSLNKDRRFIEESFPVKEVSVESAREKNIRHGHISTLHIWWARRPLASSRATNYAALIPAIDPKNDIDEWNKKRQFIIDLCKWENSLKQDLIDKARKEILAANGGKPPKVLDPFGGGGAIPLEALRLGCEVFSNDYNPVAVLIQKCTLEYPQKYGKPGEVEREVEEFGKKVKQKIKVKNLLLEDVKHWGELGLRRGKKRDWKILSTRSRRLNTCWLYLGKDCSMSESVLQCRNTFDEAILACKEG